MTKLSDTQAIILSRAAQHPDGRAAPPASLPPAPRSAVAKSLLKAGLLEVTNSTERQHPGLGWKLDGEAVFLRITDAGLRAIGVTAEVDSTAGQDAQGAPLAGSDAAAPVDATAAAEAAQDAPTAPQEAAQDQDGISKATDAPTASTAPLARGRGVRAAAQQVLAAWDDAAGERAGMAEAIEVLRAATAPAHAARQTRQPGAPRTPRSGTKQEAVLALLRRPEGASGPDMIAATGWAPHTVRGFLAGLKKRGIAVLVHERVRQVGPGKEGAKGSYTVYRIAAEPAG